MAPKKTRKLVRETTMDEPTPNLDVPPEAISDTLPTPWETQMWVPNRK